MRALLWIAIAAAVVLILGFVVYVDHKQARRGYRALEEEVQQLRSSLDETKAEGQRARAAAAEYEIRAAQRAGEIERLEGLLEQNLAEAQVLRNDQAAKAAEEAKEAKEAQERADVEPVFGPVQTPYSPPRRHWVAHISDWGTLGLRRVEYYDFWQNESILLREPRTGQVVLIGDNLVGVIGALAQSQEWVGHPYNYWVVEAAAKGFEPFPVDTSAGTWLLVTSGGLQFKNVSYADVIEVQKKNPAVEVLPEHLCGTSVREDNSPFRAIIAFPRQCKNVMKVYYRPSWGRKVIAFEPVVEEAEGERALTPQAHRTEGASQRAGIRAGAPPPKPASEADIVKELLRESVTLMPPFPPESRNSPTRITVTQAVQIICNEAGLRYNGRKAWGDYHDKCVRWCTARFRDLPAGEGLSRVLTPVGLTFDYENGQVVLKRR